MDWRRSSWNLTSGTNLASPTHIYVFRGAARHATMITFIFKCASGCSAEQSAYCSRSGLIGNIASYNLCFLLLTKKPGYARLFSFVTPFSGIS
ncbi:hypothetical protein AGR8A_Cc40388 [Agrobacterium fabrum str. J-07]|nr:hypothetical protein AGR8A_Cc40388 [Agrobacterium fabrum str. J-07]